MRYTDIPIYLDTMRCLGQTATWNSHLGSSKLVPHASSCHIIPHQLTQELSSNSISWWMNPSQINSIFILSLLCLTTNTNFHSFYFLFMNFSLVTSVPNSRDSCSCTIAQVVYEGDPARHHGSHFVIVTSGDKDISPRQLVLWHLGMVFLLGEMGETEKKHSLSMS